MSTETPVFLRNTRASYDAIADAYDQQFSQEGLGASVLERALLGVFAELVRSTGTRAPVADLGCGPGHVTAVLHELGLRVFGVDVAPRMVELARRNHPELRFHVGDLTALDLPEGTLGGVAALFSVIHVPDERLPATLAEFHRVLEPGGHLLLAFQTGRQERLRLKERFGRPVSLDFYWRDPEHMARLLTDAGFRVHSRTVREAEEGELRPRAFLIARKRTEDEPLRGGGR